MTEETGFISTVAASVGTQTAAAVPVFAPEPVPEPPAAPEPPVPDGPPQAATEPPDHVLPPSVPDQGVADWLREAIYELHRRLRNLERA